MNNKKIFIVISDGVSLRNFVYSDFYRLADSFGYDVHILNTTVFDLTKLGLNEIRIQSKPHPITNILKNVRKHVELRCFTKRFGNDIFLRYRFPFSFKGFKNILKSSIALILIRLYNSEKGILKIRNKIVQLESRTQTHTKCIEVFKKHKPDLIYNTSQRAVSAISIIQAAKQLKIPTIGFIYSWDNLPKATLDVETDFYHVWSQHMKEELVRYHHFINENQITVTGTPQFEPHFHNEKFMSKGDFYNTYNLKTDVKYICFSGDDVTTSPKDQFYLRDIAQAVSQLNDKGYNLGVVFRRCPVDFSARYDSILQEFKEIIIPIEPIWKPLGSVWDAILPTEEDSYLLASLGIHCELVINLGSSMVFDFAAHNKPCAYFNYNYLNIDDKEEAGVLVYDYMHFKSMPDDHAVYWINSKKDCKEIILKAIKNPLDRVEAADRWFKRINCYPFNKASNRIWNSINDYRNS